MASQNPFGKIKKGALHKMLGIKEGQKMTPGTLMNAAKSKNPLERRRAQFAINAKKFNHKKKKKQASIESGPGVEMKKSKKMSISEMSAKKSGKKMKKKSSDSTEMDFKKKGSKKMKSAMCMKCKGAHKTSEHGKKMKKKSAIPMVKPLKPQIPFKGFGGATKNGMNSAYQNAIKTNSLGKGFGGDTPMKLKKKGSKKKPK